jgi:ParB-like chromosome segregation protein Spo0J
MYETLPLDSLVSSAQNANRISRVFAKKLRHNIKQLGQYETITVRPHPEMAGKFQVLNGHARLSALRDLGIDEARCDVWHVNDTEADLFLAVLNRLRGSDVAELRMTLLYDLLASFSIEELAAHIPETASYLERLKRLPDDLRGNAERAAPQKPGVVIVDFYLTGAQHETVMKALERVSHEHNVPDASSALTKMAELYLTETAAELREE